MSSGSSQKKRSSSERSLANLKPFQPGRSGNVAGRPKGRTLSEVLRYFLEQPIETGQTMAEAIAAAILAKARKGDVKAAAFVRDTAEGKPTQKVQVEGSLQLKERERQVRFLVHVIKQGRKDLGDGVSVEEIWSIIEKREMEIFSEDVRHLRPAVFAALGVSDENELTARRLPGAETTEMVSD